ncbi:MAG: serine/threonine-protein kinase [Ktedonobacteraceae bacterium]
MLKLTLRTGKQEADRVDTLIGTSLGGYTLLKFLGSGGMGVVYLAEDPAIGQQVAIKIVRSDETDFSATSSAVQAIERFKQEARAVAHLDHLHILPLYRYGEEETDHGPQAYMVMQYRPEGSLWDWLRRRAGLANSQALASTPLLPPGLNSEWPLSLDEAGEYLRQAASALQYAHDHGIIHRDIKPANFLLRIEPDNTIHLLLSDFGLAKFFSSNSATSTVLGTPIYMAPEQFDGIAEPASDQYALAVMIYQFLAGRPPFEGDPLQLMHQHMSTTPPPLRSFVPTLPDEIGDVFARALAKDAKDRYPSIIAFAQAFAQGRIAKPYSFVPPFSLPTMGMDNRKRRPPVAGLLPLSNPEPLSTVHIQERQQLSQPLAASPYNAPTVNDAPSNQVNQATVFPTPITQDAMHTSGQPFLAPIASSPPLSPPDAVPFLQQKVSRRSALGWIVGGVAAIGITGGAGLYFYYRYQLPAHALHILRGHTNTVTSVNWSPDGTQLASGSRDNTARLWSGASEQSILTYRGHSSTVFTVAWSRAGHLIASGSKDKTVQVWDATGTVHNTFENLGGTVSSLVWLHNGLGLFVGTLNDGVYELILSSGHAIGQGSKTIVRSMALSPNGSYLAVGLESGIIAVTDLRGTHKTNQYYTGHLGPVHALAWSKNSAWLATGSTDKVARIWDVASTQTIHTLPHQGFVTSVAWDPNSLTRLATGCSDKSVNLWDVNSSTRTIYNGHTDVVTTVSWGTNGLASGSADQTIIIWQA